MTLEYALDDFAISQVAQAAGNTADYDAFITRAQDWRHEVNPATGYLGARRLEREVPTRSRLPALAPPRHGPGRLRGGQRHAIHLERPQNLGGLFGALGGDQAVVRKLDTFFTKLNSSRKQPYDWAGNEPSLGIPWEYDYAGTPWRTQSVVRRIATSLYSASPDGEPGNDDLGAMSSWYVWAAIGLYPEVPGRAELALASPLFPHVTVSLADGRSPPSWTPPGPRRARPTSTVWRRRVS